MTAGDIAGKSFWSEYWARQPEQEAAPRLRWMGLLEQHLPRGPEYRCLEIGCVPGRLMRTFSETFGYHITGIDYSEGIDGVGDFLHQHGISDFSLVKKDVNTYTPDALFDVVYSTGVIEHFKNYEEMIGHHCRLVREGGYVHITLPNFRGLQYWLRRWLCPQSLEGHYLPAMNAKRLRRRLLQEGFEIIYCDPWDTFDFWYPPGLEIDPRQLSRTKWYVYRVKEMIAKLGLNDFPTWWASPFIVSLARKTPTVP